MPTKQKTHVQPLGQEDTQEKGMTTHRNILSWEIPWTEKPGRLQSVGCQKRVELDLATKQQQTEKQSRDTFRKFFRIAFFITP